jgi:hypothetical protein
VTFSFVFSFVLLIRQCECSCDVRLCSLHAAHANRKINLHLYTLQPTSLPPNSRSICIFTHYSAHCEKDACAI